MKILAKNQAMKRLLAQQRVADKATYPTLPSLPVWMTDAFYPLYLAIDISLPCLTKSYAFAVLLAVDLFRLLGRICFKLAYRLEQSAIRAVEKAERKLLQKTNVSS